MTNLLPDSAAARDPTAPHILHHDLETRSTVDIKAAGAAKYAADPSTDVWCLRYAVDDEPVQLWLPDWVAELIGARPEPVPAEFIEAARNPLWTICAHNDAFERAIARHILEPRYGFPAIPLERRRCSMAAVYAAALPGSLEKAVEALGLPYPKDKAGQALMRQMSKPRKPRDGEDPNGLYWHDDDPEKLERLGQYCRRDVEAERAVHKAVPPLTADEQKLWELDAVINDRGFAVDRELLEAARRLVAETEAKLQAEFGELTGLSCTNQTAKFIEWLAAHGCVVDDVQKGTLRQALRRKGLNPEVRRAIELRLQLAHAAAVKIEALLAWSGADGRVRGTLKFHGASTGRWVGSGPQPQNFKRDSEGIDAKIAAVMAGGAGLASPVEAVGDIARAMICAAPGHRFMIGDFSGIESRVIAWVSGQLSKLEMWAKFDRTGAKADDPYYILGRGCGLAEDIARDKGKICDLAFGYQGGLGAWKNMAPDDDASTDDDIRRYQKGWQKQHPHTVAFWRGIDDKAIAAVRTPGKEFTYRRLRFICDDQFLRITLPSGRALSYPFPRIGRDDKFGHARVFFKDASMGKWADCNHGKGCYGGIWAENIVSAIARDLLAGAMRRLEAAGYRVVLTVHDELVAELPDGFGSLEEFRSLITAAPDWVDSPLPIAAKVRESARFAKPDGAPLRPVAAPPDSAPRAAIGDAEVAGGGEGDGGGDVPWLEPDDAVSVEPESAERPDELAAARAGGDASAGIGATGDVPSGNELAAVAHRLFADIGKLLSPAPPIGDVGARPRADRDGGNGNAGHAGNRAASHGATGNGAREQAGAGERANSAAAGARERADGATGNGAASRGATGNRQHRGDYGDRSSEKNAGKPYGPVRTQLSMLGYQFARAFPFAVPGETEPLFHEDRYELRAGITPTVQLPRKTCRFWHRANGQDLCDTGPRRIIFNWPAITAAGPGATVFVVEGANKATPLNEKGLLATAAPYHQWGPECVSALAGAHLIYLEDHDLDAVGGGNKAREFSAEAKKKLEPVAASFRVVPAKHLWKNLGRAGEPPHGWDVKDWVEAGGDATRLREICNEIPTGSDFGAVPLTIIEWLSRELPPVEPLIGSIISTTTRAILAAATGLGKTNFGMTLSGHAGMGKDFLHWSVSRPCRTLFIDGEMSRRLLRERIEAMTHHLGGKPEHALFFNNEDIEGFAPLNTGEGQTAVWKLIEESERRLGGPLDFVCFDNIVSLIVGDMKEEDAWRDTMPLVRALTKRRIGQLWMHHTGHDASRGYGTKTREWQLDLVMHLAKAERPDTDVSFTLSFPKARERTPDNREDFAEVNIALIDGRWVSEATTGDKGKPSPLARKFFEALQEAARGSGSIAHPESYLTASLEAWQAQCVASGLIDPTAKPESARGLFSKYKLQLIAANLIKADNETAWILP